MLALLAAVCAGCRARERPTQSTREGASPSAPLPAPVASTPTALREVAFGDGHARFLVPDGASAPERLPLVLVLHGLGGDGPGLVDALGLEAFARARRLILVAPNGKRDPQQRRFWNAGEVCCNFAGDPVDDVARLSALLDHATRHLAADPERLFVVGYSNGGFMAHRLACSKRAPPIRAVVSMAAAAPIAAEACASERNAAVLEIHGDRDTIVPFDGGHLFGRPGLPRTPSVEAGFSAGARRAGCDGTPVTSESLDLITELHGSETEVRRLAACSPPRELWIVRGGGHVLPLGPRALEAIWGFLAGAGPAR